jgi:translin
MENLDSILQAIDGRLAEKNQVRESALGESRRIVQAASKVIRAVHRHEWDDARRMLDDASAVVEAMNARTLPVAEIYWAGYVQDAQKEFAEANLTLALVQQKLLPSPESLGVEDAAYLNGLAEAASELRRYVLDLVRHGHLSEADQLLEAMEEVYSRLITVDYPHAITDNLRRTTDMLRGVLERTRGDVTIAMKQQELRQALQSLESSLQKGAR